MAPLIWFAFGPDDGFYFDCPTSAQWRRLPWSFKGVRSRISIAFQVCLGPGDDEYAAFYINRDGKTQYSMNYPDNTTIKPVVEWFIKSWNEQLPTAVHKSRLVLGPGGTFLAFTPTGIKYGPESAMSPSLLEVLKAYEAKDPSAPVISEAALGINGAWWVQFADKSCKHDLAGGYSALQALLRDKVVDERSINSLVLSTECDDQYFLVYDRRKVRFALPGHSADLVRQALGEYHASLQTVTEVHDGTATPSAGPSVVAPRSNEDQPPPYVHNERRDARS